MHLVIFTGHYPYGSGEEFLENEMRAAEAYFEKITIVTAEKNPANKTHYVPENAKIVPVRAHIGQLSRLLYGIPCILKARLWKEFCYAKRTTTYSPMTIIKQIFLQENVMSFIRRKEHEWVANETDTVYYSYWLGTDFAFENARLKGLKISRAHGGDCFFSRNYHPYRKEALRNLDFVFPVSEAGCKDIIEHYKNEVPGLEQKVRVARLGIVIPNAENPYCMKKEKTIVTCSHMIQLKRLDLLIEALSMIQDRKIRWIHFGEGALREQTTQYAEKLLGEKKNIQYEFRGYTPNQEILSIYETVFVNLFVNCSDVEGIPVSVMEAMAFGIPVIGRNVGGMAEIVDPSCGILMPSKIEPRDLAASITDILDLPLESYLSMRQNARKKIETLYDARKNYRTMFETVKGCFNANV